MISIYNIILCLLITVKWNVVHTVDQSCIDKPKDILVVLDSSDSVSKDEFESAKIGIDFILSYFPITQGVTKVALVNFGKTAKVEFDFEKYRNKAELSFKIRLLNLIGGTTALTTALKLANIQLVSKMRKDVTRIMIVVSNGRNNDIDSSKKISSIIKEQNVTIYSIAIGRKYNKSELQAISSSDTVISFDNYKEFATEANRITNKACYYINSITPKNTTKRLQILTENTEKMITTTYTLLYEDSDFTKEKTTIKIPVTTTDSDIIKEKTTIKIPVTTTVKPKNILPVNQACIDKPKDIIVLLDSSSSISTQDFRSATNGASFILSYFPITQGMTKVAMVNFGKTANVQFDFEKYQNKAQLSFAIRITKQIGGVTALTTALNLANKELIPKMRKDVARILIVVSDGKNNDIVPAKTIASVIKNQNVTIYSIGVGNSIEKTELKEISSSNDIILFDSYSEFSKEAIRILEEACYKINSITPETTTKEGTKTSVSTKQVTTPEKLITEDYRMTKLTTQQSSKITPTITKTIIRTTTPARSTTAFEIKKPEMVCNETKIDLMFAFDSSSSLSEDHWNQELQLGTKVVDDLKIGKEYSQVGMLSFSSKSVINIHLGALLTKDGIKKEILKQELMEGATFMAEALIACKDELFTRGRSDSKKTIILVTDGAANSPKLRVEEEAEKIKKLGVKIVVVGLGYSILKKQLISISSSEMYYPIENMDKISLFDTKQLSKEACYIPTPVRLCDLRQDILIILDVSSQVSYEEHVQQLIFAKQIIDLFELSENKTKIGLIAVSDEAEILKVFTTNYNDLYTTLQNINYKGGFTRLDKGFTTAKKSFYLRAENRNSRKLVILLSNGLSKEPTKSLGEAYDLQETDINIITVGVNEKADKEELKLLASPGMYLHRSDVKTQETLVQNTVKAACNPLPRVEKTKCDSNGDIIFVIDTSLNSKAETWEGMKSTVLATLRNFNITQELTRVSIIKYSNQVKTEFRLDENFNSRDIYVAIKQLKQDGVGGQLSGALRQARQLFKVSNRYNSPKALVILADKLPDNQREALSISEDLKSDGVSIITVSLSKDSPVTFFEELSSKKSQIAINNINKVMKHKEELRILLCDALTSKEDRCTLKVLDLIISMDSSSSVGPDNWKIQLDFINRIVGNLDLKKGRTRLGVFTFGTYVELRIPLNSTFTNDEMKKEVQKIPFVEGMTAIGLAIQEATSHFSQRGRENTPQVLVVLTDGSNTKGISPQITAVEAKKAGIKVITVGIGGEISEKELKDISSSGNFYNVTDFQDLEKYNAKSITNEACQIPEKPKQCDGAGDLIFIMGSGAEKGTLRWNKMADFMKTLTNLTVVGKQNTRVAILKFNKGAYIDSGFQDSYSKFEQSIETMTSSVDGVFIGKALERARILFKGDERINATKSVVIISDTTIKDRDQTLSEADLLKRAGIKIFVIGVTQNISKEDLTQVASKEKALFVNDFHNLNNYNAFIAAQLCEVIKGTSKECSNKQLEVMIAMDSSSSIGPYHWQTQLSFVEKIVKDMDISKELTRVGLITFNTKTYKQFGLTEFSDKYELISVIKQINFTEGLTAIGDALRDCKIELLNNSRRGAPQIIILITDGVSKGGIPPEDESIQIKKYGIKIISIGIGDSISLNQLKFLSSSNNVYSVLDYTSLKEYDSSFITRESCQTGKLI